MVRKYGPAVAASLMRTAKGDLQRALDAVENAVLKGQLETFGNDDSRQAALEALERYKMAVPALWSELKSIPPDSRWRLMQAMRDVLLCALEVSSRVDRVKVPVWHDDQRRNKAAKKRTAEAQPRLDRLRAAVIQIADHLKAPIRRSEKFYLKCQPHFASYLEADDLRNGWPSQSTFLDVVAELLKHRF